MCSSQKANAIVHLSEVHLQDKVLEIKIYFCKGAAKQAIFRNFFIGEEAEILKMAYNCSH